MLMQPSLMAETSRPFVPRVRLSLVPAPLVEEGAVQGERDRG
jgi:hypothetical protein